MATIRKSEVEMLRLIKQLAIELAATQKNNVKAKQILFYASQVSQKHDRQEDFSFGEY